MTLTESAYFSLRRDIVRGVLVPGQPLKMEELRKRYDMGFSPLREALSRLQAEGLVQLAPLRGFAVTGLSLSEMWEMVDLRILIESEALRLSIEKGNDEWEAGVVASLHALVRQAERTSAVDDPELWELEDRHHKFHRQLLAGCGSIRMLMFFERLYVDTERYRIPVLLTQGFSSGRNIQAEHSEIAEAALARKTEKAQKLLARHYRLTAESIEEKVKAQAAEQIKQPRTTSTKHVAKSSRFMKTKLPISVE